MSMSANALRVPYVPVVILTAPTVFFTVDGSSVQNPRSVRVVEELKSKDDITCLVFDSPEAVKVPPGSVLVVDDDRVRNQFSFGESTMYGARWVVKMGNKCDSPGRHRTCANNAYGIYVRGKLTFRDRIDRGNWPWGPPAKKTAGPRDLVQIDTSAMAATLRALNGGPNLVEAIAHRDYANDFPKGSKISWLRVPPKPLGYSAQTMGSIVSAVREFERACGRLIFESSDVREQLLAGVVLQDERLRDVYVNPGVECFSVMRLDAHWGESGVNISEDDEMPGGMPELVHIDNCYDVNGDKWDKFFGELFAEGPLLFAVSHEWSKPYVAEVEWLVGHLQGKGYPAHLLMTDQLQNLHVGEGSVTYRGARVGTVWRLFPIFEAKGMVAELVLAARRGAVRLVPEFAHFGNKSWFQVFWNNLAWYEANLEPEVFSLLKLILPESGVVSSADSFPLRVDEWLFGSVHELAAADQAARDSLVLKVVGANNQAARSYGVLMGDGIPQNDWAGWVMEKVHDNQPFLVQRRFRTSIARIPVWHTGHLQAEMFFCRLLMRPWAWNGEIVSVHGCAVPHQYHKVHGMSDMAVIPVLLE